MTNNISEKAGPISAGIVLLVTTASATLLVVVVFIIYRTYTVYQKRQSAHPPVDGNAHVVNPAFKDEGEPEGTDSVEEAKRSSENINHALKVGHTEILL